MKKLFVTLLTLFACGSAYAVDFNVSAQGGFITDEDYGNSILGAQVAADDIYKGFGLYAGYGEIFTDTYEGVDIDSDYWSTGLSYSTESNMTLYLGYSEANYDAKFNYGEFSYSDSMKEKGVEFGGRYNADTGFALGLGYNTAVRAMFGTVGYTF